MDSSAASAVAMWVSGANWLLCTPTTSPFGPMTYVSRPPSSPKRSFSIPIYSRTSSRCHLQGSSSSCRPRPHPWRRPHVASADHRRTERLEIVHGLVKRGKILFARGSVVRAVDKKTTAFLPLTPKDF